MLVLEIFRQCEVASTFVSWPDVKRISLTESAFPLVPRCEHEHSLPDVVSRSLNDGAKSGARANGKLQTTNH